MLATQQGAADGLRFARPLSANHVRRQTGGRSADSLKLIPSVFFDGIARVVPGATAIVSFLILSAQTWSEILAITIGPPAVQTNSLLISVGLFLFAAYVVGQLIAPFAKIVQRLGEWEALKPKPRAPTGAYDFLRLHHKDAGAQCAKIRAEFTMYNGLTVVLLVVTVDYAFHDGFHWGVLAALLTVTVGTGLRGRSVRDTFNGTVAKFARATTFPKPPAA